MIVLDSYLLCVHFSYFSMKLWQYQDLQQLCNDPRAKAAVLADMDAIGREAQAKCFYSSPRFFFLVCFYFFHLKFLTNMNHFPAVERF